MRIKEMIDARYKINTGHEIKSAYSQHSGEQILIIKSSIPGELCFNGQVYREAKVTD
jgi:hypothetical protein